MNHSMLYHNIII